MTFRLLCIVVIFLSGCSHQGKKDWKKADEYQRSRYTQAVDSMPLHGATAAQLTDAVPRHEPKTKAGNLSPYKVFGKTYRVLPTAKGYAAKGDASWYGMKFHGHKTSNGEIYDVNKMSAAHKTLPLPSYVKVTNLVNGKTCVVRINDRGPFKHGRLIDLSYAAAKKLDYIHSGTARVKVEAITPKRNVVIAAREVSKERLDVTKKIEKVFLQVGAYKDEELAQKKYRHLSGFLKAPLVLKKSEDNFFRLFVGPILPERSPRVTDLLTQAGFPKPLVLQGI